MKANQKIWIVGVFAIALISLSSVTNASVMFVGGDVSGTWSSDSVIVADSVRVPAGQTLTIEPGVSVLFLDYYKFEVLDGAVLHAVGTETEMIKFIPFSESDKSLGLDFINASSQSILEYVYISNALTSGIHLNNSSITIRNSLIENSEAPTGSLGGGGIELINSSNALIEHNTVRDNYSADYGGGIYVESSSPIIRNNVIENNLAGYYGTASGGGIAFFDSYNPEIVNNLISNNTVQASGSFSVRHGRGGGLYFSNSANPIISGNEISGNTVNAEPQTTSNGGGIFLFNSDPLISHNLIVENSATGDDGGGLYLYSSNPELINNTIAYNIAGDSGGGVFMDFSNPTIVNTIIYFNQAVDGMGMFTEDSYPVVSFSDIQGSWSGEGNVDIDPLFRDAANGDYHLQDIDLCGDDYYSPLIDAGTPQYSDSLIACEWGHGTTASDMGAYGGGNSYATGVDDDVVENLPVAINLSQNYPNPFNATTTISYNIATPSHVKLEIFDLLGRSVSTLVDEYQNAGTFQANWNASDVSSGTFFYRLQSGQSVESKKMVLLK
jgi:parallel beta-helix repeat protein